MKKRVSFIAALAFAAHPAMAGPFAGVEADVFVLGEVHDNAAHHRVQAEALRDAAPSAVVFEMLTAEQAALYDPNLRDDPEALAAVLGWEETGWPDFEIYYPIFEALGEARVFGAAVPRAEARSAFEIGVPESFGPEAAAFGLADVLPEAQREARMTLQRDAHCGKLPDEMLPVMIDLQRLRDATLARTTLAALDETGGPVAVITGNGHARADWGMPAYIARVAPEVVVTTLGQSEDGAVPDGTFDVILDAPGIEREDPCLAFE